MKHIAANSGAFVHTGFEARVLRLIRWLRDHDDGVVAWLMFLLPLGVLVARRVLAGTAFNSAINQYCTFDQVRLFVFGIIAMRELLFGRYNVRAVGILALFTAMGFIAYGANYQVIVDGLVFMFAARNLRFNVVAKFLLVELAVLIAVVFVCSAVGVLPDVVFEDSQRGARHSLGFGYPNTPAIYLAIVLLLWANYRGESFGWVDAAVCLAAMLALFQFTGSRSALVVLVLFLLLVLVFKRGPEKIRSYRALLAVGLVFCVGFVTASVILCAFYSPDVGWMAKANSLVSGRISLGHDALNEFGTTLFGQQITLGTGSRFNFAKQVWVPGNGAIIVDNLFIRLIVTCGIAFCVAAAAIVVNAVRYYAKRSDWMVIAIAVAMVAYAVMESAPASLYTDPFLLLLAVPFGMRDNTSCKTTQLDERDSGPETGKTEG